MKRVEFLIVGQGLAGTVLAFEMLKQKVSFHIVTSIYKSKVSAVAAGMVNPLVFKRLTKTWMADELIPVMNETYSSLEGIFSEKLFFNKTILKPLSRQEKQLWNERQKLHDFSKYINKITDVSPIENISNTAGYGYVAHSGYLNLSKFLELSENYFRSQNLLTEMEFLFQMVESKNDNFKVENVVADKIIFCEGAHISENPYFNFIKMKPVKGEVLQIFSPELSEEFILNKGVFVLPVGNHRFKIGSTYEWEDLSETPTEKGKKFIIERFQKLVDVNYSVEKHWAGIRPAVIDRRPVLGAHPRFRKIFVFNGLGTKGVMLAPFFAKEMLQFCCETNFHLHNEVVAERFV